ncbi:4871_t:CDS:2 [Ambispora leptoticha]|uniref:histone acetyltransferase n=1 Tax=Ambispora leptoticha TaxID=144679 RepID=A0A9N8VIY2_9GLOM|nr:4871_t:CDS:2 [Ambispora leptoticha]
MSQKLPTSSPKYNVQLISTELKLTAVPVHAPQRNNRDCNEPQATRSLLLLLQEHFNTDRKVLVAALEAYEYYYNDDDNAVALYISKVDTTGFQKPVSEGGIKSLTKLLISGFLSYYATQLKHLRVKLHLCARAQPEYLFTYSAKNPAKRLLSDVQLIRWWKTLLQQLFAANDKDDDNNIKGWFLIPGVTSEHEARRLIKDPIVSPTEASDSHFWTYGSPYSDSAIAEQVVPRFADDPKLRFFETLNDPEYQKDDDDDGPTNFTVKEFWEMISITTEFNSGKNSAFFWIYFGGSAQRSSSFVTTEDDDSKDSKLQSIKVTAIKKLDGLTLTDAQYYHVISNLENLEFFPLEVSIDSTNTFAQLLREICSSELGITFNGKLNSSDQEKTSNLLMNQQSTSSVSSRTSTSKTPSSNIDVFDSQLSSTPSVDMSKESLEKTELNIKRVKKSGNG